MSFGYPINDALDVAAAHIACNGYRHAIWTSLEVEAVARSAIRRAVASIDNVLIHPLGFARIALSSWDLDKPRVAVHVWSSDQNVAISTDIHDHCYDFTSICITGAVHHRLFELTDRDKGLCFDGLAYAAGCCENGTPAPDASQHLALVGETTVAAHQVFSLPNDILHQARPITDPTVTIQFQSPCSKSIARVYRSRDTGGTSITQATPVSLSRDKVIRLLQGLSA